MLTETLQRYGIDATEVPPVVWAVFATSLSRILASRVSIVPSEELARDAAAMEAHRVGAASITEATAGAVLFVVETTPTSPVVFRTSLDATPAPSKVRFQMAADWMVPAIPALLEKPAMGISSASRVE